MAIIITNTRTNEQRVFSLRNQNTIEEAADYLVNRIHATYPKAYKLVHNRENHISIMAGNVTKCIFDIKLVEELRDYDDYFLC